MLYDRKKKRNFLINDMYYRISDNDRYKRIDKDAFHQ